MIGGKNGDKPQSVDIEVKRERGWKDEVVTFRMCQVKTQGKDFETEETIYEVLKDERLSQVCWTE